jgi:integrase
VALLTLRGFSLELQDQILKQPYQPKTFKEYCFGWKKVALFVKENDHPCSFYGPGAIQQFYVDFILWVQDPQNKRITASTVRVIKTSLSTLLQVAFSYDPTEAKIAKNLAKTWNKSHKQGARYLEMWNAADLLDWCEKNPIDFSVQPRMEQHDALQTKTMALIALFTLLRPNELASLKFKPEKDFRRLEDGIVTYITVKSYQNRITQVFIHNVENFHISPRHHVEHLLKLRKEEDEAVFINLKTGQQLSLYMTILALKDVLGQIGQASYGAYSFKHAAMTFLVKQKVPEKDINAAARYSSKGQPSIMGKYYACSEATKQIFELIAKAASLRDEEEKNRYDSKVQVAKMAKERRLTWNAQEVQRGVTPVASPYIKSKVKERDPDDSISWEEDDYSDSEKEKEGKGEKGPSKDATKGSVIISTSPLEHRVDKEMDQIWEPVALHPMVRTKSITAQPAAVFMPAPQLGDLPK